MPEIDQNNSPDKDDPDFGDELESLSSDEKAAFDKIMAEISAATGAPEEPSSAPSPKNIESNGEEVAADAKDETPPIGADASDSETSEVAPPNETVGDSTADTSEDSELERVSESDESQREDERLDDEQQAALDAIMEEIENKGASESSSASDSSVNSEAEDIPEGSAEEETPESKDDQDDEELSDDQQAALDNIMAEINSKRGADADEKEPPAPEKQPDDEELSDDQQAALDNIMAEINSKRGADADEKEPPAAEKEPDEPEEKPDDPETSNLTIEEFDDELSNLLTEADQKTKEKSEPAAETSVESQTVKAKANDAAKEEEKEYPILQEVSAAEEKPKPKKAKTVRSALLTSRKKAFLVSTLVICLIVTGGYYAYRYYTIMDSTPPIMFDNDEIQQPTVQASDDGIEPLQPAQRADRSVDETGKEEPQSELPVQEPAAEEGLAGLKNQLSAAREQLQVKISDINQLKSYYARGIAEETEKIEQALEQGRIPAFNEAMSNKRIELALRAIQRRNTYIAKLGTPISQLTAMSEELLYLERRRDILETLSIGINGLPITAFEQEAASVVNSHLKYNTQLSIDQVEVAPMDLSSIWGDIVREISKKTNLLAQRAPLNRAIGREICRGNYERKYQLTALSVETTACLIRWPGQDLYLNSLNELTPEAAELLSQWSGEWISLNGIKELPAETAKHLAAWPGKRLSLNGLTHLSSEATAHLSQWGGEQLEMVGLHAIGSWENYGTRLFLSEKLRRQLEAQ